MPRIGPLLKENMKKLLSALFLVLASCSHVQVKPVVPGPEPTPIVVSAPVPTPTPTVSAGPNIVLHAVSGYDKDQTAELALAQVELNRMIGSQCFQDFFMKTDFQDQTNGMSNSEVVSTIRNAKIDVPVVMVWKRGSVVGYTYPDDPNVYTNYNFYVEYGVCLKASNLGHESTHKMGFDHDFNNTARRPYSVPYTFNRMAEVCCTLD